MAGEIRHSSELRGFDREARELVQDMLDAGWNGRLSSKGHAIMRAPDGVTTSSIARDSLRGRSGRNARADFKRWQSDQDASLPYEQPVTEFTCQCGLPFASKQALGAHQRVHMPSLECEICGKHVKYMEAHILRAHPVPEKSLSEQLLELASAVEKLERGETDE